MATLMSPNDATRPGISPFRSKSLTVDTVQWTGQNLMIVQAFLYPKSPLTQGDMLALPHDSGGGLDWVHHGEWIVRLADGQFAALTQEKFQMTYEPATEVHS